MKMKPQRRNLNGTLQAGFTLIELIVVTGILMLISSLMLVNNARFGGEILLENLAYDVALSIRRAQVYGIAVRRSGGEDFSAGYGVHFEREMSTTYVLFSDTYPPGAGNGIYEVDEGELLESTTMQRGFRIVDLCAVPAGGVSEVCNLDVLDVLFERPEPNAFISVNDISGIVNPGALHEQARVVLESPRGDQVSVVIEAPGQIAVQSL